MEEKEAKNKEILWQIIGMVITMLFSLLGLWVVLTLTDENNDNGQGINYPVGTTTPVIVQPSQYPDYDSLNNMTAVPLITATTSSQNSRPIIPITGVLEVKGKFSRVYLYGEASVNGKPLTDWDSLYVGFRFSTFSLNGIHGHLFRPDSLPVPQDNKSTRLLFNTSVVSYIQLPYSASKTPSTLDWFNNIFNNSAYSIESIKKIYFDTFISTTQIGTIHLIALYYSCAEETPDCYIR
jgi:hypothetical protein